MGKVFLEWSFSQDAAHRVWVQLVRVEDNGMRHILSGDISIKRSELKAYARRHGAELKQREAGQ